MPLFNCRPTPWRWGLLALSLSLLLPLGSCAAPLAPSEVPAQDTVFTATREVRGLSWNAKTQTLWAATAGGVLRYEGDQGTKWTRAQGLPANETFAVDENGTARFPVATARLENGTWAGESALPFGKAPMKMTWRGKAVKVSPESVEVGGKAFPLPPTSAGTHLAAVLAWPTSLEAAISGDGLYCFDGAQWVREANNVPDAAREITALAGDERMLWVGTRRAGIWHRANEKWTQWMQEGEVWSHNVQFLTRFRGVLWASTLDDGLVYRDGATWRHVTTPDLSSSAPRGGFIWRDTLYVRFGTGVVDSFDGTKWTKNALATIPRRGIYALGGDETRLVATGWGGFCEWDGATWTPHTDIPALKGIPIVGVLADGDAVYLATQSRGLGVWNRATGAFRWLDERSGLPDDWVTTLGKFGGHIYAGTFVGGLARLDGVAWFVFPELRGENVTSLCASPDGKSVLAATRHGLFQIQGDHATKVQVAWLDAEDQALLPDASGVWIGARTSLNFWRTP